MRTTRFVTALLVAGAFAVAQGCADDDAAEEVGSSGSDEEAAPSPEEPQGDKAGNSSSSDVAELTLSLISSPERPRGALAARFAEEIEAQGGPVSVDVQYGAEDPIADFMSGAVDMVLTPTNALDRYGVTTFRALSLPFLVEDDDQADRVATDPVVDTMLAGLDAVDATGLLFAPIAEEHLAVQGEEPLRSLDQLAPGVRVIPQSDVADGVYEALGTEAKVGGRQAGGYDGDAWDAAVRSGDIVAKEFPTALFGVGPLPVVMATNLALTYDFEVLMIRDDALAGLSTAAADSLWSAAASAQQRQIDERLREDDAFRDECLKGADLSAAPVTLWAEIGRAVDDFVLEQLQGAPTKDIYDAVKRAAGQRTASWPNECTNGEVVAYEPPTNPGVDLPEGTYRVDGRSVDQLLVSGVGSDTANPGNLVDYWQLVLADGVATLEFHRLDGSVREQRSTYSLDDAGRVAFVAEPDGDGLNGTFAWSPTDDGFRLEPLPTDRVEELNVIYDVAGLGLFEFTRVD